MNREQPHSLNCLNWIMQNLANIITLLGFLLCAALLWTVIAYREQIMTILILVILVFLTDFLDGKVARFLGTVSRFGGAMDRLRDKLLLGIVFLFLILDGRIQISLKMITVPLTIIETALLIYWFKGIRKKIDVSTVKPANKRYGPGQIKMFLLSVAILLCILNIMVEERFGKTYHFWATCFLNILFAVSFIFAVKSLIAHKSKYYNQL